MRTLICLSLCLLLLPTFSSAAEWYPGVIHLHTTFSDGTKSPLGLSELVKSELAKHRSDGKGFMVVTDHYEQIGKASKGLTLLSAAQWLLAGFAAPLIPDGPYGYKDYSLTMKGLCSEGHFVAFAGAEFATSWNPEPKNTAESHTLAIRIRDSEMESFTKLCKDGHGRQQEMIWETNGWGMLPIAAHPSHLLRSAKPKRVDYRYDIRPSDQMDGGLTSYRGLGGVEFWNVAAADQLQSDLDFYLRLLREQHGWATAISGSDYHGILPSEDQKLNRVTWVYADDLVDWKVLDAIENGRTYASRFGVRLSEVWPIPGVMTEADVATIRGTVVFAPTNSTPKRLRIYRDGSLVHEETVPVSVSQYAIGDGKGWRDTTAEPGEHWYVVELENVLVTSPLHYCLGRPQPFSSLLQAQREWFEAEKRLSGRGDQLSDNFQNWPIYDTVSRDLSGDGDAETISIGYRPGGSACYEPVRIAHPRRGSLFSEDFGDGGSLLLMDLDPARTGTEIVTVKYVESDETQQEAQEQRRVPPALAAKGIAFDTVGVRDRDDDLFECHMGFHRYEVKVYGWTSDGRCELLDVFRTARKYPLYVDRNVLWEFSDYWLSKRPR